MIEMGDRLFIIHVCLECGFYDADPVLRRMPGSRHEPKRCFQCSQRAIKAIDFKRIVKSFHAHYRQEAERSAPLMVPTKVKAV